jgi:hypothetical protein
MTLRRVLTLILRPIDLGARSVPLEPRLVVTPDRSLPLERQLASVRRLLADRPELRRLGGSHEQQGPGDRRHDHGPGRSLR